MARGAGKRQTASFVFPLCGRSSPGRYGLRGRNRDTAPLHLGDAWRYGELAGCAPAREQGPGGVSPIGGQRPPYWSFLKGEIPKRGKIEIPLFGPSFRPLSSGRKGPPGGRGPPRFSPVTLRALRHGQLLNTPRKMPLASGQPVFSSPCFAVALLPGPPRFSTRPAAVPHPARP